MPLRDIVKGLCEKTKCFFDVYTKHYIDENIYTKDEMDGKLAGKSNNSHSHDDRYYTESEINAKLAQKSDTTHNHDGRYYTETEIDNKLASYKLKGDFAVITSSITISCTDSDNISGSLKVNYPSGFNKNNCVILNTLSRRDNLSSDLGYSDGIGLSSSAALRGTIPHFATLRDSDIMVRYEYDFGVATTQTYTIQFKVILMKV